MQAVKNNRFALRVNGWINIIFGIIGIVATFIFSPWWPMNTSIWQSDEIYKVFYLCLCFFLWALLGWYTLINVEKNWLFAALCPLGGVLLVGSSIPDRVIESKQLQFFVKMTRKFLQPSHYILTNSIGIALGLVWSLQRDDIIIYR